MMKSYRACKIFLCAWLVLATTVAAIAAAETCPAWRDDSRLLALGQYAPGLPRAAFPLNLPHGDCGTAPSPDEAVCEHFDGDGVGYLVDAVGVTRVEARKGRTGIRVKLPLALRFGDTQDAVRRKLAALPSDSPVAALSKNKRIGTTMQSRTWATPACIETSSNTLASFYVTFDRNGKLTTVGMRLTV